MNCKDEEVFIDESKAISIHTEVQSLGVD